ncbi:uncharacterized protein EV420DRAFT_1649433 [Desarmillaria tabescens]|uniref:CxC2-like cysteine cluster KDZ transposase-associated domain-containing protein n=1 Tax=Armillaria tabescens TaxID=1929756 RepID=A0AA39JHT8_ARMTA|nr:uncharacterized protein EV420DRAFT_1649433 [Desarmillaria tabescens]KAK0443016.1 hypothetical protein EV420DRAFT_1649433 [Desarmillaria tabescens]
MSTRSRSSWVGTTKEQREFLEPYIAYYHRLKADARKHPKPYSVFQSQLWLLWKDRFRAQLQPPDPTDKDACKHWYACRQKDLAAIIRTLEMWEPFYATGRKREMAQRVKIRVKVAKAAKAAAQTRSNGQEEGVSGVQRKPTNPFLSSTKSTNMNYNPRKKGRRAQMDILDTADDDNTVQINIDLPLTQEYHWHTDHSLSASSATKRHTGRSARVTTTHLPLELASDNIVPTSQESLASSAWDGSLAVGMSALSFLDPDHEVPTEFALASNDSEGARLPRPMGMRPPIVGLEIPAQGISRGEQGKHRCLSCFDGQMLCRACIIERHWGMPFHRVEVWNGSYFKKISLGDLGLVVQLGHKLGQTCLIPAVVHSFVVIDVDGIHMLQMGFCECTRNVDLDRYRQLL